MIRCVAYVTICSTGKWSDRAGCLSIRYLLSMSVPFGAFNKLSWSCDTWFVLFIYVVNIEELVTSRDFIVFGTYSPVEMWVRILNIVKPFERKMVALVSQLYFLAVKAINCCQHLQEHSRSYHCMKDLWITYWFKFRLNINRDTIFLM